jgi:O-antigen biosynthesis protein
MIENNTKSKNIVLNLAIKLLPSNTKRGLLSRVIYRIIRHPRIMVKNSSLVNFKRFIYFFKTSEPSVTMKLIDNRLGLDTLQNITKNIKVPNPENILSISEIQKLVFKKWEEPEVSVIIPVFNQWRYTYNCLKSIIESSDQTKYELIIANDCSTDDTHSMLNNIEGISVVENKKNSGFIKNCNMAAEKAKGKYLLFLNNDTYVTKGWLSSLVNLMERDQNIGLAGSKLLYPEGTLQEAGCIVWNDLGDNRITNLGRGEDPNKYQYNFVRDVDYCSGCSIIIRKHIFKDVGGFDVSYIPAYSEDSDLAFTVRKMGYRVVYQPGSTIVHYENITYGKGETIESKRKRLSVCQNKFYDKWKYIIQQENFEFGKDLFIARDRSRNKKHLLIVDDKLPTWDKDAGSLTIYSFLKVFLTMGYRITFIPDNHYKLEPYTSQLQQMGIEVMYDDFNFESWISNNGKYLDTVLLSRPDVSIKYIDLTKKYTKATVLYYMHDLHHLREQRRYEIERKPEILDEVKRLKNIEFSLFNKADIVLTPSEKEKEILVRQIPDKRIEVVPPYMYEETDFRTVDNHRSFEDREGIMFLGGFGHSPNIDAVQWLVNDIFPLIRKKIPNIQLDIVGSNPTEKITELASDSINIVGYVSDMSPYFEKVRVFVAPLRYGAGLKGKIVTSMFYGVPVVTTYVGNEGLGLVNKEDGMLADDPKEFADKVCCLYLDKQLWEKIAKNSLEHVKRDYSMERARKKFLSLVS